MKKMIISVILFLFVVGFITTNSIQMSSFCNELNQKVESFSVSADSFSDNENLERIKETIGFWKKNTMLLDLSLNLEVYEKTEGDLLALKKYCETADYSNYCTYRELCLAEIEKISETSRLSLQNIL